MKCIRHYTIYYTVSLIACEKGRAEMDSIKHAFLSVRNTYTCWIIPLFIMGDTTLNPSTFLAICLGVSFSAYYLKAQRVTGPWCKVSYLILNPQFPHQELVWCPFAWSSSSSKLPKISSFPSSWYSFCFLFKIGPQCLLHSHL